MEPAPAPADLADMTITDGRRLELSPAALRLSRAGDTTIEIARARVLEAIERYLLEFPQPAFVVRQPKRRVFKLSPDQAFKLSQWLGPDFGPEIRHQINHRIQNNIPFAAIYVISNPHAWSSWVLGGVMLLEGLVGKYRPSHWVFLFQVVFWSLLLASNANRLVNTAGNVGPLRIALTLVLPFFLLLLALSMFRRFHRILSRQRAGQPWQL